MDLSEDNGRFSVLADGTLVIQRVVTDDAGEYVCEAQSPAGSAFAKAKLNVRGEKNYADAVWSYSKTSEVSAKFLVCY